MLLGVDVGGTFTDAVLAVDGAIFTAKAPTTPSDQSQGVIAAVEAVLGQAGARAPEIELFSHGMTVATNALLEGRGARTAFIATDGFADLVALGRQNRPELYRLCAAPPSPITPPERRFGARERMTPAGPLRPLEDVDELVRAVAACEPEAVAVALLHSYRHPEHERELGAALETALPDVHVSLSHEVVGTFREFERAATTEVDAALSPLLGGYLRRLRERCAERSLPEPAIMQSNGGLIDIDAAAGHAAWTVLSGPAGGAAGAAFVARSSGEPDALCFDMGGTSCDVCVVDSGAVQEQSAATIAGRPLALPMLAVSTVGAGGGSIAWRDAGGALRVGPQSAGADPGPACYGLGGELATVTDANLLLGRLRGVAGGISLDRGAAERAIGSLASELGIDVRACADGIVRVANAEMVRALRVVTVQRGIDPRRYALLAFGGAGPLHACAIADELGITRIVVPRASGVLAALGLVVSARRRDVQRSVMLSGDELTRTAIERALGGLGTEARSQLRAPEAELTATFELRYRGQAFELAVTGPADPEQLREAFEALHEERYGYRDPGQQLELVTVRVSATIPGPEPSLGERAPGAATAGPAIIELPESTLMVAAGWSATPDRHGTIHLAR
jgi:N-methylhydantoinase A